MGQVDATRGGESVPLPEPRVDLHQLVPPVPRVALELDLRQPAKLERSQQTEARIHDLVHPECLTDPARPDEPGSLAELAPTEEAERPPGRVEVAAERVESIVTSGNQLLHHRLPRFGAGISVLELRSRLAPKALAPVTPLETDGIGGFDQYRIAELDGQRAGFVGRLGMASSRHVDPGGLGARKLHALVLDPGQGLPGRKWIAEAFAELGLTAGDSVQALVVGGEDRRGSTERVTKGCKHRDEAVFVRARIGSEDGMRVTGTEAESPAPVIDRQHRSLGSSE